MATPKVYTSDDGTRYRVRELLGRGGFGATYRVVQIAAETGEHVREVCLKVCESRRDWHGEAFYGELLAGNPRVVRLLDAFVDVSGGRGRPRRTYCLVFELMPHGTVDHLLRADRGTPFMSETMVRKEIDAVLTVLGSMHAAGITHRDIKPANVYVKSRKLVLGDFGISAMTLTPRHRPVDAFSRAFSPQNVDELGQWGPRHDVFQVALLTASLLTGRVWGTGDLAGLARSELPEDIKCWIWHATSTRESGYRDAVDAAAALSELASVSMRPGAPPPALRGEYVVLTGKLDDVTRGEATQLLSAAGAHVQGMVGDRTTLVVRGTIRNALTENEGRKLFQVRERRRRGQKIRLVAVARLRDIIGDPDAGGPQ